MADIILSAFVFLSTVAYGLSDPSKDASWTLVKFNIYFMHFAAMALLIFSIFARPERKIKPMLAIWLLGIGILNVVFNQFDQLVMSSFINIFFWVMGLYVAVNYIENPHKIKQFIIWAAIVNIYAYVFQKFGWNPMLNTGLTTGEEGGVMGNMASLSTFLAITLPFLPAVGIIFCLILGVVGKELGLLVACAIVIAFKINRLRHPKKNTIIAIIMGALTIFFIIDFYEVIKFHIIETLINVSMKNRIGLWRGMLDMAFRNIWVGYGLGQRPIIPSGPEEFTRYDYALSSFIQFFYSVGFAGIAFIIFGLKQFKERFNFSAEAVSILIFIALCIFKYPVEVPRIWLTLMVIIALFIIDTDKGDLLCS